MQIYKMTASIKRIETVLSSAEIRNIFINYFINEHKHKFVRSSSVVPYHDATLAFVNAGMNQFKSVFLGKMKPPYKRVTNYQKCVRVGGKHNDLDVVGQDGYHHTFFEMLGNWSFGDYFKKQACSMALELLCGPYNIDRSRLYVTYFGGDKELGLSADLECFEIWQSLGFPKSRILPFSKTENFWEMGSTGPCGPCTEIHILNSSSTPSTMNNNKSDLMELWNLVFIQYNRNEDGSLSKLPSQHVDTGMGFERLTAILQNTTSNYETDLFTPIFNAIPKLTSCSEYKGIYSSRHENYNLDMNYRLLADHARMVTVCLGDGMLPDMNQKLRRVLRKALIVSEKTFGDENLLRNLVPIVITTFNSAYPDICNKQQSIIELIDHEKEIYKLLREKSSKAFDKLITEYPKLQWLDVMECSGFVPAFQEFQKAKSAFKSNQIPGDFLYKLTDTYGLTEEHFKYMANFENMSCDINGYHQAMHNAKLATRIPSDLTTATTVNSNTESILCKLTESLPATDHQFQYNYKYDTSRKQYCVANLKAKVLGIVYKETNIRKLKISKTEKVNLAKDTISIITNASNFYNKSGGQVSDVGFLKLLNHAMEPDMELKVVDVRNLNDCIIHCCELPEQIIDSRILQIGDEVLLQVDSKQRTGNIVHHTATHLINAAIRTLYNKVTYQVYSKINPDCCKLELGLVGRKISVADVEEIENLINNVIQAAAPVRIDVCDMDDIIEFENIVMIPGEIYPEIGLRVITIPCDQLNFISKELCCGTHASNTEHLQKFHVTNVKQTNRARFAFTAVAGEAAHKAGENVNLLEQRLRSLESLSKEEGGISDITAELQQLRHNAKHMILTLPYVYKCHVLKRINSLLFKLQAKQ